MVKETSVSDPGRMRFDDIIHSASQGKDLTKEEIIQLLRNSLCRLISHRFNTKDYTTFIPANQTITQRWKRF